MAAPTDGKGRQFCIIALGAGAGPAGGSPYLGIQAVDGSSRLVRPRDPVSVGPINHRPRRAPEAASRSPSCVPAPASPAGTFPDIGTAFRGQARRIRGEVSWDRTPRV